MENEKKSTIELNNEIILIENYIDSAKRKSLYGTLLITLGALGALAFAVDYFAIKWDGIAPFFKFVILASFAVVLFWGSALRANPGVKIHEPQVANSMVTTAKDGYRTVRQLEIELRRVRDEKKKKASTKETNVQERRKSYREDAAFYVEELRRESAFYRRVSNLVQAVVIVGSLVGSFAAASSFFVREYSWFVAANSLAIGIASGFAGYWKYKERSFYAQQTADLVEHEIESFDLEVGRYESGEEDSKVLTFSKEIIRLRQDQKMREQNLDQPSSGGEESKK
ncbi:hypothetical protein [Nocardiopsis algeriensis]|uniref:DUF4231 domain-containing protein n=1 Tax=Nocardiopsis algeriensis TaxID=1478215 RepID=A0A841ITB1_9ACTN|nr:hypothetical protein [Nocardiopsis algeriensis]MBB6121917.1 hypothetical protein [Nocardiopsis algeriensis]